MKKMYIVKLNEAWKYIQNRETFRASNMIGLYLEHNGFTSYVVMSYATIIYAENKKGVFINRLSEKFSQSTSRHQSIVRRALNIK